jgi:hypothetical protein
MPQTKSKSKSRSKSKSKSRSTAKIVERLQKVREKTQLPTVQENNGTLNEIKPLMNTTFLENYKINIAKIREALKDSGKHKINKENAETFINEQLTPLRRQAAKDLIDNTKYITLKETFNIVEELIMRVYSRIDTTQNIFLYCGDNNKSFYFFACIAYYFILKHDLKQPIFIKKIGNSLLDRLNEDTLIIVDDASYSGSQLGDMLDSMHYYVSIEQKRPPPNIEVLLTAVNTISLDVLSKVSTNKDSRRRPIDFIQSPLHINVLDKYNYNALVVDIGIERYFNINLFFNVFLSHNTHIALYLDHKVANTTSTYKNAYVYGPIIPSTYNLRDVYTNIMGGGKPPYMYQRVPPEIKDRLYEQFIRENPEFTPNANERINYKNILDYLMNKAIKLDIIDKPAKPYISFSPFIQGCSRSTMLKNIIKNNLVKRSKYVFFMYDFDIFKDGIDEEHIPFIESKKDDDYMREHFPTYETLITNMKQTVEVINILDSFRCPKNFYKEGILRME